MLQANKLLRRVGAEAFEDEDLRPLLLKEPTVMGAESLELHGRLRTSTATPGPETTTTPTRAPTTSAARTTTTDRFSR